MKQFVKTLLVIVLSTLTFLSYAQTGAIRINQLGYYPDANKVAMVIFSNATTFDLINTADSTVVFSGDISPQRYWYEGGDSVSMCDFSAFTETGTYKLRVHGFGESYPFEISNTVLRKAAYASLNSYYYKRCSYELTEAYAGLWKRGAGHPDTDVVLHSSTGKSGTISSPGGWYDAGDYGKYVVNAGISVATMLSFYENFNDYYADGTLHIPESANGENDLLDEIKVELDWLKTMQDDDGGVFHKLTTLNFDAMIMPAATNKTRYAIGKSTAAALDFAAMMAMAGRIYQDFDSAYAADCIILAGRAWEWAKANPAIYFSNPPDVSTGQYGDNNVNDEFIWAAAELYISTQDEEYKAYLESHSSMVKYSGAPGWNSVQSLGALSLATQENGLSESMLTTVKNSIISASDSWLTRIEGSPFRLPSSNYFWGSSSGFANIGVGLLYAHILTNDSKYIKGAAECADYILGKNGTGFSFVSLYGYKTPMKFHDRPCDADGITQPIPGYVAGGPNPSQQDGQNYPFSKPAKSYVDVVGSYASNEICINWNSPLIVLLAGVDAIMGDGSDVDFFPLTSVNNPPVVSVTSPRYGYKAGSDEPFLVKGRATDADGISKVELYIDARYIGETLSGDFEWTFDSLSMGEHVVTILAYDIYGLTTEKSNIFEYTLVTSIPGKVRAEHYSNMKGVSKEVTTDEGGGENVTGISNGDYVDFLFNVREAGDYRVEFRVASSAGGGKLELRKMSMAVLCSSDIEATGGSQSWVTLSGTAALAEGRQTLRVYSVAGGWNFNWINFVKDETSVEEPLISQYGYALAVLPNPVQDFFTVKYSVAELSPVEISLYDMNGRLIEAQKIDLVQSHSGNLEWQSGHDLPTGSYILSMQQNGKQAAICRLLKSD